MRYLSIILNVLISFPILFLGCCPNPLLNYGFETPATVLLPIRFSNIIDGRTRFKEIYCAIQRDHGATLPDDMKCEDVLHKLDDDLDGSGANVYLGPSRLRARFVIIPGIFQECFTGLVTPFFLARNHVETLGFKTELILVSGLGSSSNNAEEIRDAIDDMDLSVNEKLVFIGYSKGASDILEAVTMYTQLAERTMAIVSLAGVVGGTPIADRIPDLLLNFADQALECNKIPEDEGAFESLKRSVRQKWLVDNTLPGSIKYFSLVAFANKTNISPVLKPTYQMLSRIDPRNDSQVLFYDAIIPGATLMGYLNADHWSVAMPFNRFYPEMSSIFLRKNAFPREVLLESIIRFVEESLIQR